MILNMQTLTIIGAGGHGKVVADVALAMGYVDISFLDDCYPVRQLIGVWPIRGKPDLQNTEHRFCAIGANTRRAQLFETLDLGNTPVLIHPFSSVSPSAMVGNGTLMAAGAIVSVDVQIGRGVILNTGCSVDHDCVLGDFVHVSPGVRLAGNVSVGDRTWIGLGAVVREGVKLGTDVIVAAGAAVIHDIPDNMIVGGVPARPFKLRN